MDDALFISLRSFCGFLECPFTINFHLLVRPNCDELMTAASLLLLVHTVK